MEEVRVAKERNFELSGKLGIERLNLNKKVRRIEELEMSEQIEPHEISGGGSSSSPV